MSNETETFNKIKDIISQVNLSGGSQFDYAESFGNFVKNVNIPIEINGQISPETAAYLWSVRFATKGYKSNDTKSMTMTFPVYNLKAEKKEDEIKFITYKFSDFYKIGLAYNTREKGEPTVRRLCVYVAPLTRKIIDEGYIKYVAGQRRFKAPTKYAFVGAEFALKNQEEVNDFIKYVYLSNLTDVNGINVEERYIRALIAQGYRTLEKSAIGIG
jgi:hypothetical protein